MGSNPIVSTPKAPGQDYLNQALQFGVRQRRIKTNPAATVLLPERRPPTRTRKSFTIEEAERLLVQAIPADPRPAMWLTGLMCGLRPGELAGLRWPPGTLGSVLRQAGIDNDEEKEGNE